MQEVEAELVSSHDYMSNLEVLTVERSIPILQQKGNWGWVFLRDEEV